MNNEIATAIRNKIKKQTALMRKEFSPRLIDGKIVLHKHKIFPFIQLAGLEFKQGGLRIMIKNGKNPTGITTVEQGFHNAEFMFEDYIPMTDRAIDSISIETIKQITQNISIV